MTTSSIIGCASRKEAVKRFLDIIEKQGSRIEATKRKLESIYRFQTPDRPFVSFDIENGHEYQPSSWVSSRCEYKLDTSMQSILFHLEAVPQADYLPILSAHSGRMEFLPRLFGGEYDIRPEGAFLPKYYLIHDLENDIQKLPEVDILKKETVLETLSDTVALIEMTQGKVCVAYPYMQGCFNNVYRFMDQGKMLMACIESKELMSLLMKRIYHVRIQILKAVRKAVGNDELLRIRGFHPPWIRSLMIDDFISVVKPQDYFDVCSEVWQAMYNDMGPVYLHTCGPISQCIDLFEKLPGLLASEFVYVDGQEKTTAQIELLKKRLYGKVVLFSIGLSNGYAVDDTENLTGDWVEQLSRGGGFMFNATGSAQQGRHILDQLL